MLHNLVSSSSSYGVAPPAFASPAAASPPPPLLFVSGRVLRDPGRSGLTILLTPAVRAADAGRPCQTRCTEMVHWDDYRSERVPPAAPGATPAAPSFVRMGDLFDPKNLPWECFGDDKTAYMPQSVAVQEHLQSAPRQTFCAEMLHWDEYREEQAAKQQPPGAPPPKPPQPSMSEMFRVPGPVRLDTVKLSMDRETYTFQYTGYISHTLALNELLPQAPRQTFCTEMLHYDEVVPPKTGRWRMTSIVHRDRLPPLSLYLSCWFRSQGRAEPDNGLLLLRTKKEKKRKTWQKRLESGTKKSKQTTSASSLFSLSRFRQDSDTSEKEPREYHDALDHFLFFSCGDVHTTVMKQQPPQAPFWYLDAPLDPETIINRQTEGGGTAISIPQSFLSKHDTPCLTLHLPQLARHLASQKPLGSASNQRLPGSASNQRLGSASNLRLPGLGSNNQRLGSASNQRLPGSASNNQRLPGSASNQRLGSASNNQRLLGLASNNQRLGSANNQRLPGLGSNNQRLPGSANNLEVLVCRQEAQRSALAEVQLDLAPHLQAVLVSNNPVLQASVSKVEASDSNLELEALASNLELEASDNKLEALASNNPVLQASVSNPGASANNLEALASRLGAQHSALAEVQLASVPQPREVLVSNNPVLQASVSKVEALDNKLEALASNLELEASDNKQEALASRLGAQHSALAEVQLASVPHPQEVLVSNNPVLQASVSKVEASDNKLEALASRLGAQHSALAEVQLASVPHPQEVLVSNNPVLQASVSKVEASDNKLEALASRLGAQHSALAEVQLALAPHPQEVLVSNSPVLQASVCKVEALASNLELEASVSKVEALASRLGAQHSALAEVQLALVPHPQEVLVSNSPVLQASVSKVEASDNKLEALASNLELEALDNKLEALVSSLELVALASNLELVALDNKLEALASNPGLVALASNLELVALDNKLEALASNPGLVALASNLELVALDNKLEALASNPELEVLASNPGLVALCLSLPDFNSNPYGKVLLFSSYDRPDVTAVAAEKKDKQEGEGLGGLGGAHYSSWLYESRPPGETTSFLKEEAASLAASAISPAVLKDILNPSIQFGLEPQDVEPATAATHSPAAATQPDAAEEEYAITPAQPKDLRSVENLVIARRDGRVKVHFLDPVNLEGVDVPEAIKLTADGQVVLYPHAADPPPPGDGLNVRALVSIFGVTNVTEEELRRENDITGTTFVSYCNSVWEYMINEHPHAALPTKERRASPPPEAPLSLPLPSTRPEKENATPWVTSAASGEPVQSSGAPATGRFELEVPTRVMEAAATAVHQMRSAASPVPPPFMDPTAHCSTVPRMDFERRPTTAKKFVMTYDLMPSTAQRPSKGTGSKPPPAELPSLPLPSALPEPVYMHSPAASILHRRREGVTGSSSNSAAGASSAIALARSFRVAWHPSTGAIYCPTYAELTDSTEEPLAEPRAEVRGAGVARRVPFPWQADASQPLPASTMAILQALRTHMEVRNSSSAPSLLLLHLHRTSSTVTLSENSMEELRTALKKARGAFAAPLSRTEESSLRQCDAVLRLLNALYGLPEEDRPMPNALEEHRYMRQLRHRNLEAWVQAELAAFAAQEPKADPLPAEQQLVQHLLNYRLREAQQVLTKDMQDAEDLARVLRVCGSGNQFGGFVEMAARFRRHAGGDRSETGAELREQVVSLLSGKLEPFISTPEYRMEPSRRGQVGDDGPVSAVSHAAAWKQLLGAFVFYGCTPDTAVEDIVGEFMDRLRTPTARRTGPLPPYAEKVDDDLLQSRRGRDLVHRGADFPDASFLLLDGFRAGTAPSPVALHPHASSYCATDYLTPMVILCAIRSIQLPRSSTYVDAENAMLRGLAGQLERHDDTWFWGLVPLHLLEDDRRRTAAVTNFCERNALRASRLRADDPRRAEMERLLHWLQVKESLLKPISNSMDLEPVEMANRPSLQVHGAMREKGIESTARTRTEQSVNVKTVNTRAGTARRLRITAHNLEFYQLT
eukprot:gene8765-6166_t